MKLPTGLLFELRGLMEAIQEEASPEPARPIVVSGMLCEQLARELSVGAAPGAVLVADVGSRQPGEVRVHVMAGEPTTADEALVREADHDGTPVVLVQLWPQEQWTPPFVLTPFVVECRAGEGFPTEEIGRKIVEAAENWTQLARRVPVLHEIVADKLVRSSVIRAGLLGALGGRERESRSALTLEQTRTVARLQSLQGGLPSDELSAVAGAAASAVALGFLFREAASRARDVLPAPVANAAVAAAATWVLATAARRVTLPTG
jgi:hypothetical protein